MVLEHIGLLLTTFCNLNCRDCADLLPKRCNRTYDINMAIEDLSKVINVVDRIEEVLLIGGETLLYKDLDKAIEYCYKQSKIGRIIITTNGTIMPSEKLMTQMAQEGVIVRLSGYPKHVSPNRNSILDSLLDNKVNVENLENMTWFSMGSFDKRNRTPEELTRVFHTCMMKFCVTISPEGKLFYCSRQMAALETDLYPNPFIDEYVDIRNSLDLVFELEKFFSKKTISTCDYCDGISCATNQRVETAIQILPVSKFLELVEIYYAWDCSSERLIDLISILKKAAEHLLGIKEFMYLLEKIDSYEMEAISDALLKLICSLSEDYNFVVDNLDLAPSGIYDSGLVGYDNRPNKIKIAFEESDNADLILTQEERVIFQKELNDNSINIEQRINKAIRKCLSSI